MLCRALSYTQQDMVLATLLQPHPRQTALTGFKKKEKEKKNIAAQMSRFSGPGMLSLLSPPEKLLASSECEMPSYYP